MLIIVISFESREKEKSLSYTYKAI